MAAAHQGPGKRKRRRLPDPRFHGHLCPGGTGPICIKTPSRTSPFYAMILWRFHTFMFIKSICEDKMVNLRQGREIISFLYRARLECILPSLSPRKNCRAEKVSGGRSTPWRSQQCDPHTSANEGRFLHFLEFGLAMITHIVTRI